MACIGVDLTKCYNAVPPPSVGGWSIRKGLKKVGRGVKRGVKGAGKGVKKVGKGVKKVGKVTAKLAKRAIMAAARLAAKPVTRSFKKLAGRRARLLSWNARKSMQPTRGEKQEAARWAVAKMNAKGKMGRLGVRVLRFVGEHKSAGLAGWHGDTGLTGAEIAAVATTIAAMIAKMVGSMNKPGEAPADPRQAEEEQAEEEQAEEEQAEEEAEEETFEPSKG